MLRLAMILLIAAPLCAEVATIADVKALPEGVKAIKCDPAVTDEVLGALAKIQTLEELDLYHCREITTKGLSHLSALKLRSLSLDMCRQLDDAALVEVGKLTSLEELNLHQGVQYTHDGMKPLGALVNLRSINLGMFWGAGAEGLEHVLNLPKLEALALRLNQWVTNEVLARIVEAKPGLKKLDLRECRGYSLAGLTHLAKLKSLTWLDVGGYKTMSREMLAEIAKITSIEHLNLIMAGRFDDDALLVLKPLTELRYLSLEALLNITGECFKQWQPARLEVLELKLNDLTVAGLEAVSYLKSLRELYIWAPLDDLPEDAFRPLERLENLVLLSFWYDQLEDAGLEAISRIKSLKALKLTCTEMITDKGLAHLGKLKKLELLEFFGGKMVSDEALAALRRALPNCEFTRKG